MQNENKQAKTAVEVAEVLEQIAQLLELEGENPFKIRAYIGAARALEFLSEPLEKIVSEGRLGEIAGIGKAINEKITELMTTGRLPYYEELRNQFPAALFELFELQGLGAKKIKLLYEKLGVASVVDLEKACHSGAVAELPGFGVKSAANFEKAIAFHRQQAGLFRIDQVSESAEELLQALRAHPDVGQCQTAGSFRRHKEALHDLDLLVSSTKPEAVSNFFVHHPLVEAILMQGPTKSSVLLKGGLQCDLRVVKSEEFPFALVYFTGSKEHNIRLRNRALEQGWSLNEYRFTQVEEKKGRPSKDLPSKIHDEQELYQSLGLDFIPPELREDRGDVLAAAERRLPKLVDWMQLKGTFHCHTKASDGQNTLVEMAAAAQELGLQYLGIADHSKSSHQAHGLSEERLAEQITEIHQLNKTFEDFRLFAGTECDILKDGSLDFSDEVLASLDYVVASVHSSFTIGEVAMTDRIIRAMENRYMTMLGHMTGRILISRASYSVNVPALLDAAAATGTIIELNANPRRLDMDWRWWFLAKEKGVRCVINPDAHTTLGLQNLTYGVGIARKGWLTKDDVINTLPTQKVMEVLNKKKIATKEGGKLN